MEPTYERWIGRWEAMLSACSRLGGDIRTLQIAPPAAETAVNMVETELGTSLPVSLRRVLTEFSAAVEFRWLLPEDLELPGELSEIFSGECRWSLAELTDLEQLRRQRMESCFPDPDNAYDRVWHNKIGFLKVDNGDLLALDLEQSPSTVVYLSLVGGDGHGFRLGDDFEDFIERWSQLGCPGPEDWQMLPFTPAPTSLIDPEGSNAVLWRQFLQLPQL